MLLAATVIFILAVLAGAVVFVRSALRASRRLAQVDALASTGTAVIARAREVSEIAQRVRSDTDRVQSVARLFT